MITLLIHCGKYMVCHKMYYIIKHWTNTFSLFQMTQSTRTNSCQSHSLPNIPPFYPSLVVPASPSVAVTCCVCLPASWLCVRMAVGMYDCRYRVILLRGILNLSMCLLSNSGHSGCVSSVKIDLNLFVTNWWQAMSMLSCLLPTIPPAFLVVLSSLPLSCLDAFPPQQVIPKVITLLKLKHC